MCPGRGCASWGWSPRGLRRFELVDDTTIKGAFGEVVAAINGDAVNTLAIFGTDGGPTLLGAYTLEGLPSRESRNHASTPRRLVVRR